MPMPERASLVLKNSITTTERKDAHLGNGLLGLCTFLLEGAQALCSANVKGFKTYFPRYLAIHSRLEICWNNLLDPRWSHSCPGCYINKLKPVCPYKCSFWPETQGIQSANPQTPSHLRAFSPQTKLTMWPWPIWYFLLFSSLSFVILWKLPSLFPISQFSEKSLFTLESVK